MPENYNETSFVEQKTLFFLIIIFFIYFFYFIPSVHIILSVFYYPARPCFLLSFHPFSFLNRFSFLHYLRTIFVKFCNQVRITSLHNYLQFSSPAGVRAWNLSPGISFEYFHEIIHQQGSQFFFVISYVISILLLFYLHEMLNRSEEYKFIVFCETFTTNKLESSLEYELHRGSCSGCPAKG